MAHNLEMNGDEVAFALRGTPAWHNLANRIFAQDESVSTQMMLDEAKLSNWKCFSFTCIRFHSRILE